jgi:RNA polymerase sigma-54 factor
MDLKMGQHVQTGQQLKLAPRIIQTMEIMQLPLPALEEKIEQELESNIALELADAEPQDEESSLSDTPSDEYEQSEIDLSELPPRKAQLQDRDPKLDALASIRARQESLSEVLLHQWSFAEVDKKVTTVGVFLIGLIDTDGFITLPASELLAVIKHSLNINISTEKLDAIFHSLHQWLDPPGIAARSLQESLLIQVNSFREDDNEGWDDVALVIETHLDDLVANRLPKVAASTNIGIDRIKRAIEKMHELTLSPGRLIATDTVLPVIPDAFIEFDDLQDLYVVGINSGKVPSLKISTEYETITANQKTSEDTKQFIQRNINAARWIIEAVTQRKKTLQNIVKIVADRQRDFLDNGDAFLRPLPMVEVADMLGIHVATVSRAVADKWLQTPRGIFPLRRFFSGGTGSHSDGKMSWEAVKTRLQEIVEAEDKTNPLSDEALAKKLREQGIDIARRTIVKYRQQLGLPAARLRKEY